MIIVMMITIINDYISGECKYTLEAHMLVPLMNVVLLVNMKLGAENFVQEKQDRNDHQCRMNGRSKRRQKLYNP